MRERVVIIGGGVGGLTSAALLASHGLDVTLLEAGATPGGKLRGLAVGNTLVDAGPTVFTMRGVFEDIFEACGSSLGDHLTLTRADVLARHAWSDGSRLDLHADPVASADAIGDFAGAAAAAGYRDFAREAKRIHDTLDAPFMRAPRPNPISLGARIGLRNVRDYARLSPFTSVWSALQRYFPDPRLRQLFARYATYCGSSPFAAPSTLMLIAHVEATGVWLIEGGMHRLAHALTQLAENAGAKVRCASPVAAILTERGRTSGVRLSSGEVIPATRVVVNADPAALASGRFGDAAARAVGAVPVRARSLSALVWLAEGVAEGWDTTRHNVVFSDDYRAEFDDIAAGRTPRKPTVYVCDGERGGIQIIVNAPADGDRRRRTAEELSTCEAQMRATLAAGGLTLATSAMRVQTPADFEAMNPSTGGALYGRASHGWAASFRRQSSRTRIAGLYCAGGSCHPGAGVPMAALSGRLAVDALLSDLASTAASPQAATAGGTSTRSAKTAATG